MEGATARTGGYKYVKEKSMASIVKKVTDYAKEIPGATKELAKEAGQVVGKAGQAVGNAVKAGIEKNIAVNQAIKEDIKCPQCNGTGKDSDKKPCKPCKGTGWKNGSPF